MFQNKMIILITLWTVTGFGFMAYISTRVYLNDHGYRLHHGRVHAIRARSPQAKLK